MAAVIRRLSRSRIAAATATLAVAVGVSGALAPTSHADDTTPPLTYVHFLHSEDLTGKPAGVQGIGVDDGLGLAVVTEDFNSVWTYDTKTYTQHDAVPLPFFNAKATSLDPDRHIVYLGESLANQCEGVAATAAASGCDANLLPGIPAAPAAPSSPVAPKSPRLGAIELTNKDQKTNNDKVTTYTLPASAAGMSVVAIDPFNLGDRHLLYVLVNRKDYGTLVAGTAEHQTTLFELDADKLLAGTGNAVIWSHDVSLCASFANAPNDFLGVDPQGRFAYFDCRGNTLGPGAAVSGTFIPAGAVVVDFPQPDPTAAQEAAGDFVDTYYPAGAPLSQGSRAAGDQPADLLIIGAADGTDDKLYVFDALHRAWTGSIPATDMGANLWGIAVDDTNGELYTFGDKPQVVASQATVLPVREGGAPGLGDIRAGGGEPVPLFDSATGDLWLFGQTWVNSHQTSYPKDILGVVYHDDHRFPPADNTSADPDAQTHDVDITDQTPLTYQAIASGYGLRVTQVGGVGASAVGSVNHIQGVNPGNPSGDVDGVCAGLDSSANPPPKGCVGLLPNMYDGSRAVTFAESDASTENSGISGTGTPYEIDTSTQGEFTSLTSPGSLIGGPAGFFGQEPPDIPDAPAPPDQVSQQVAPATCQDFGGGAQQNQEPAAAASCDAANRSATVTASTPSLGGGTAIQVAHATSTITRSLQANNVTVVDVTSEADGIVLAIPSGPTLQVGSVVTHATTTSGGRPGTATSTFSRTISDLTVTDPSGKTAYSCGFATSPSCDPRQITEALSTQSPFPIEFLLPEPDRTYGDVSPADGGNETLKGSPGGAEAEVIKTVYQYFNDQNVNGDASWEVPGLQVIVVGDQAQPSRFVFEFAGVHAESHQWIDLAPPPPAPLADPSLTLSLVDGSTPPVPLAGGSFSLLGSDGNAVQTCATAADGIGTCKFADVKPGSYTIHEDKAPPGFAAAADYPISLEGGQDYKVAFVNLPAIGSVKVTLTGAADHKPLSGGAFALFTGSSALGTPAGTCTTVADGTCHFDKVPLGDYTLHQVTTPHGFVASKDVTFSLTQPGQAAELAIVDGIPGVAAVPARFIPGTKAVQPHTQIIGGGGAPPVIPATYTSVGSDVPPVVSTAPTDVAPVIASLPSRLAQIPVRLSRLLVHSPQQAVLLLLVWILLGIPAYLAVRRRQLLVSIEGT